jgi:hypothetical protein
VRPVPDFRIIGGKWNKKMKNALLILIEKNVLDFNPALSK